MADPFEQMAVSIRTCLGVAATTASGSEDIVIEHGVAITGDMGEVTSYRSVASIRKAAGLRVGDHITVGADAYVLDAILKSDGYFVQFVLRAK